MKIVIEKTGGNNRVIIEGDGDVASLLDKAYDQLFGSLDFSPEGNMDWDQFKKVLDNVMSSKYAEASELIGAIYNINNNIAYRVLEDASAEGAKIKMKVG